MRINFQFYVKKKIQINILVVFFSINNKQIQNIISQNLKISELINYQCIF
jgi:hypothetical protein